MKLPIAWLKEFIDLRVDSAELVHRLTMAGLEVEALEGEGKETVLTLGLTPNRADCLSIAGLAREVSALFRRPFALKPAPLPKGEGKIQDCVQVKILDFQNAPRYMARAVLGLRVAPSPSWLQKRLVQVGLRPVNNVVDCANYVMWELGQPLHPFDLRFLRGRQIIVQRWKEPIRFKTLDGVERLCDPSDLLICDQEGPVALAGIMGGADSEVRQETQAIVLEAACFDPKCIHRSAKRLQLSSESSHRFERGVDPNGVANALNRVVQLIVETAGGKPTRDWVDIYPKKVKPVLLDLAVSELQRVLGLPLPVAETKRLLGALGFKVSASKQSLKVEVPTFRFDMARSVDLVEEVARLKGYDAIPATLPQTRMHLPITPRKICAEEAAGACLTGLGFSQTCSLSFISLKKATPFVSTTEKLVYLSNPLSEEHLCLRPSLIPGLLDAVSFNVHRQRKDVKLFALQKTFAREANSVLEKKRLGVVGTGKEWALQWQLKGKEIDFYSLKGVLAALASTFHMEGLQFESQDFPDFLVSTSAASVYLKGQKVGWCGLFDPQFLKNWDMEEKVYGLEIDWDFFSEVAHRIKVLFQPLSKYPYIERDLALVVDSTLPAEKVLEVIEKSDTPWIEKIQCFDLFKGGNLPPDKKSLAFNIRYASREKTLTHEEVNEAHNNLIRLLEKGLSAQLRT